MRKVTVSRDHYNVVWDRPTDGARSRSVASGLKAAMEKAMYEAGDVAKYSGVSLSTVYNLMKKEGYAYDKNGQPKVTAEKVAALFFTESVDSLFKSESKQQPKSECTEQPVPDCE